MSRRANREEVGFGSDSFLDIIANIVGILIILIVIAGVRLSQVPPEEWVDEATPVVETPPSAPVEVAQAPIPLVPEPEPEPVEPSPELVHQAKLLEQDVASLESAAAKKAAEFEAAKRRYHQLQQQIAQNQEALTKSEQGVQAGEQSLAELQAQLEKDRIRLNQLRALVTQAEKEGPPVKAIRHKVTPIGRQVDGNELHFRLAEDKVAYVPLEELLERLKPQITRHKERLLKSNQFEGQVGPVEGFTMQFIVERQQLGVLEEMRHGQGMVRIGVSEWQIDAEPDLEAETAAQAVKNGSRFQRTLARANPGVTLTFWVYPDSYGLFRVLKEQAHEYGFTVAARPLPKGVPIAGSPRGTRSSGQ